MTFSDLYQSRNWRRVEPKSTDWLDFTPMGGLTIRKLHTRVEIANGSLHEKDHVVSYYDGMGRDIVISAIVVDEGSRGAGHGHAALIEIIEMADILKWEALWVEACKIGRRGIGKSTMDDNALRYWYQRHGFVLATESSRKVMVRRRVTEG